MVGHGPLIAAAVRRLLAGDVVGFPTETVYGLAADAGNAAAVARIFALKGRPPDHPLIVHIADPSGLARWAVHVPPAAVHLAAAFWPGPLTLILPRAPSVLDAVTGGQNTVGLRCPSHPLALRLLQSCTEAGIFGLAAPSANRFGHVSPTSAAHVQAEFGAALLVLDGGPTTVGIESTIVDLSGESPRLLRSGMLDEAQLVAVLGQPLMRAQTGAPRVSGSLAAHYAPATPLELVAAPELASRILQSQRAGLRVALLVRQPLSTMPTENVWIFNMPQDAAGYAQQLYGRIREADALALDAILVEALPTDLGWAGLRDRLQRAACGAGRRS